MSDATRTIDDADATRSRIHQLEAALVAERERAAGLEAKHDRLHEAFRQLQFELELLKRRLFHAKAERIDTGQLELEFAAKLAALDVLAGELQPNEAESGMAAGATEDGSSGGESDGGSKEKAKRTQRRGRRDFNEFDLPEERIEVSDPELDGKVERIGTEESSKVMWVRGGFRRVVFVRFKYKPTAKVDDDLPVGSHEVRLAVSVTDVDPSTIDDRAAAPPIMDTSGGTIEDASPTIGDAAAIPMPKIVTAPMPPMLFERSLATPSLVAHIASDKWCDGLPLHRQEDRFSFWARGPPA